jgi:hypothetical protein
MEAELKAGQVVDPDNDIHVSAIATGAAAEARTDRRMIALEEEVLVDEGCLRLLEGLVETDVGAEMAGRCGKESSEAVRAWSWSWSWSWWLLSWSLWGQASLLMGDETTCWELQRRPSW